jgi:hypothetical protein
VGCVAAYFGNRDTQKFMMQGFIESTEKMSINVEMFVAPNLPGHGNAIFILAVAFTEIAPFTAIATI